MWFRFLDFNKFTGTIPTVIGNLPSLSLLWASNNYLSGTIPTELARLSTLTYLKLGSNNFHGCVPEFQHNVYMDLSPGDCDLAVRSVMFPAASTPSPAS